MTLVKVNRRYLGWFLVVGGLFLIVFSIAVAWPGKLSWWLVMPLPWAAVLGWLLYQFLVDPPVLGVGDGWFEIFNWPGRSIRIPLERIKSARIREPWDSGGKAYFLEIGLDEYSSETKRFSNTFTKREIVRMNRRDYAPPNEPFLIFQTQFMNVSDAELCAIVEREKTADQERRFGESANCLLPMLNGSLAASAHASTDHLRKA